MEGILYKWTNYWNGWQPRWFVLDKGGLAYYKFQDDVKQGCKGSVQLSACEIIVHSIDTLRLDIVINEQHFYLKAPSSQERHAWLVALGNAKAGLPPSIPKAKMEKETDIVKSKKSELRLTCDLLMKQVYDVKNASNNPDGPDIHKLDEATALLSATCETFIQTLEECMQLAETARSPQIIGDGMSPLFTILSKEKKASRSSTPGNTRQNSVERHKSQTFADGTSRTAIQIQETPKASLFEDLCIRGGSDKKMNILT